jgi:hypothetical protein
VQTTGVPEQVPFSHVSFCVHALLSLQGVPASATGFVHAPVDGSHVPVTWH